MKRSLLSLLLVCVIYAAGFAQLEVSKTTNIINSDKWVNTTVKNMKGELGMLDMVFPDSLDWNIWIYMDFENKFVNSFYPSHKKKSYNLSPGKYNIKLSNVPVENVTIEKGKATRIRAGVLNTRDIISEGSWDLYDESKEVFYTSDTKPKKMVLPVGIYYLKLPGNTFSRLEITDELSVHAVNEDVYNPKPWIIGVSKPSTHPPYFGRLNTHFPRNPGRILRIEKISPFGTVLFSMQVPADSLSAELPPSIYRVTLDWIPLPFVPIEKAKTTRIKAGYLYIYNTNDWALFNETKQIMYVSGHIPYKYALPVGNYYIRTGSPPADYEFHLIKIKDLQIVNF